MIFARVGHLIFFRRPGSRHRGSAPHALNDRIASPRLLAAEPILLEY